MKAISLFTGIGGLDLGLERAGIETVLQVEQDEYCRRVLAKHWPDVRRMDDVRLVARACPDAADLVREKCGQQLQRGHGIDLIHGGFPCQDVSVAGKRAGLSGERSGLWFEFARIVGELRPRWVLIENVPGLLSSNRGRDFAVILAGLDELGFDVAWGTLDAQYFGVPQRRRRVFVVGGLRDAGCGEPGPSAVLALRDGGGGDTPARREAGERIADSLTVGANQYSGFAGEPVEVAGTLGGSSQSGGFRTTDLDNSGAFIPTAYSIQDATREKEQNGLGISDGPMFTLDGASRHAVYVPETVGVLTAKEPLANGAPEVDAGHYISASVTAKSAKGSGGPAGDEHHNLTWVPDTVSTLAAGAHPGGLNGQEAETQTFVQSGGVRRLTPTECERLQGFPDGWTEGQSDSHRFRQLGNAVAVPVAEWIGHRLMAVDSLLRCEVVHEGV